MANYRPRSDGRWTLTSQFMGWGLLVLAVLLVGTFLLGMYYGYSNGYQAAKQAFSSPDESSVAVRSDTDVGRGERGRAVRRDTVPREPGGAITRGDLRYTEETDTPGSAPARTSMTGDTPGTTPRSVPAEPIRAAASDTVEGDSPGQRPSGSPTGSYFTIQVVSSQSQESALRVRDRLREQGHPSSVSAATVDGNRFYRVRLGRFPTRSKATQYAEETQAKGHIENYWISKIEPE